MRNDLAGPNHDISADWPPRKGPDTTDEALIAKIASGNRLAMQALFARHHTRVYRFVLRMVGDVAAAEDLTSDVFLSVWQQAHRFEARSAQCYGRPDRLVGSRFRNRRDINRCAGRENFAELGNFARARPRSFDRKVACEVGSGHNGA